jgi:hypothetical protein
MISVSLRSLLLYNFGFAVAFAVAGLFLLGGILALLLPVKYSTSPAPK